MADSSRLNCRMHNKVFVADGSVAIIGELPEIKRRLNEVAQHLVWGRAVLIFDIPGKNDDPDRLDAFGRSGALLTDIALRTRHEMIVEMPYLLVMPGTLDVVDQLIARSVRIKLLTNSLASTDVLAIYTAYKEQWRELLSRGLALHEMRPRAASRKHLIQGWSLLEDQPAFSLHAKTVVFDRKRVFVSSFNMDPRSTHLSTELGLLVHSPALARQLLKAMADDFSPDNSWRVSIDDDWQTKFGGERSSKGELYYGTCLVSIPKGHIRGGLEVPAGSWRSTVKASPRSYFVLRKLEELDWDAFISRIRSGLSSATGRAATEQDLLIFINGYNLPFHRAVLHSTA